MKQIPLANSRRMAQVSDGDYALVKGKRWSLRKDGRMFYAVSKEKRNGGWRIVGMHTVIKPGYAMLDHQDANGLNNLRRNLRPCNASLNAANCRKQLRRTSSRFKGVHWHKRSRIFLAHIKHQGTKIYLGSFHDEEAAAIAYNLAARKLFGRFARLNVIATKAQEGV